MDYYNQIKNELLNNEVTQRVKDYSKNKSDLTTYYNVGKILTEAGKHYGESIIKNYSKKLVIEVDRKYNERTLRRIRQYYKVFSKQKWSQVATKLSWSHYVELLPIKNDDEILYYINISVEQNLSRDALRDKIKSKEYERLPKETIIKLKNQEKTEIQDFVKNPIIIKNRLNFEDISEKALKALILEDIDSFLKELGDGFCYIENEYKIKIGDNFNYIDILLFNIKYNCYTVVELKVTELKKEHIGQVQIYMNYIDKNIKTIYQDKTIGIIITKKNNQNIIEYSSDPRIYETTYMLH